MQGAFNMSRILCFDFGTSSIRAAIRVDGQVAARPLELGEAVRSSIDRASIPSSVFVSADLGTVWFGEQALRKGLSGEKAHLFEMSPKNWMTGGSASSLGREILKGMAVSERYLLAGLLAQAFSATMKAARLTKAQLDDMEVRTAHPVWPTARASELRAELAWIVATAIQLAGSTDNAVSTKTLQRMIANQHPAPKHGVLDVVEPVAGALELFDNTQNSRELCMVVDVGAGTTDLAIFLSLTPDAAGYRRKLVRAADPISIRLAGDHIDAQVLGLIEDRAPRLGDEGRQALQRRRRLIKETLFSTGKVFEAGVEVTLRQLEARQGVAEMSEQVKERFSNLIKASASFISTHVNARTHRVAQLDVVFAGGGSRIRFLHKAIGDSVRVAGRSLPIMIRGASTTATAGPASIERLAVALGGTTPGKYWPVTSLQPGEWVLRRRSLG
jgi:hypothetical protein